ncbi:hypothetical protein Syun_028357 [Stephania yunnanensis]|uniref:Coclaurine N-methyltransferase n=1 Tax=Stephania yunnanensis TaxID=152371 RepID=A0AAP0EH77_9MAGN
MSHEVAGCGEANLMKATNKAELMEKLNMGLIPDKEVKRLIRDQLESRIQWIYNHNCEQRFHQLHNLVQSLQQTSLETKDFNTDVYDLPIEFVKLIHGRALKQSGGYYKDKSITLDDAEKAMLDLYCERAQIKNGDRILDIGCGYGALAIHIARKYPQCHITGITDTTSHCKFIEEQCRNQNLNNVEVIQGDITKIELNQKFDRVTVIEVFEHIKNYDQLMKKISKWMKEDGLLFVENMCHKNFPYQMKSVKEDDWIEEMIFPDMTVTISSADLLLYFQKYVSIVNHWIVDGKHTSHSNEEWLKKLDDNIDPTKTIITKWLGSEDEAVKWINQWRIGFMHGIEQGKFNNGEEWMVAHFLFKKN